MSHNGHKRKRKKKMSHLPSLFLPALSSNVRFAEKGKNDIEVHCIQVPWQLYENKVEKKYKAYDPDTRSKKIMSINKAKLNAPYIQLYIQNVLSDPRLGNAGLDPQKDTTNSDAVQKYAREKMHSLRSELGATMHESANDHTRWMIEYVVNDQFARYCLVPEDTASPLDRVNRAIVHIQTHMTETSMANPHRPDAIYEDVDAAAAEKGSASFVVGEDVDIFPVRKSLIRAREWWLTRLQKTKEELEKNPTKNKEFLPTSDGRDMRLLQCREKPTFAYYLSI